MAVTDSTIGNLPAANLLENSDMFAIEQGGEAKKLTGLKLKDFIQDAGEIFIATRTTNYAAVEAALADGKFVVYVDNNNRVYIHQEKRGTTHFFVGVGVGNTPPNLNATYTYATLTSSGIWTESSTKELQALLTWDATPTGNSNNPVRSGGIKTYVDDAIAAIPEIEVDDALDDTSENPVQNKVITDAIYNSLATDSASGSIASFPDGADNVPVKSLVADIDPVQNLNGYDNPWPAGGGKNKCPLTVESIKAGNPSATWDGNDTVINGVTFTILTDSNNNVIGIRANGTATSNANLYLFSRTPSQDYSYGGMILNGGLNEYVYIRIELASSPYTNFATSSGNDVTIDPSASEQGQAGVNTFIRVLGGYTANNLVIYPMIRLASETDATFAPYENICPIEGWTGAEINDTGINIWDEEWENGRFDESTGAPIADNNRVRSKDYISVVAGESYYFKRGGNPSPVAGLFYDVNKAFISSVSNIANQTFTVPNGAFYMMFYADSGYGTTYNNDISINYPATDTAYHSGADNKQIAITWQDEAGTVYGATLTYIGGGKWSLQATKAIKTLTGAEGYTWTLYGTQTLYTTASVLPGRVTGQSIKGICSAVRTSGGNIDTTYMDATSASSPGIEFKLCLDYWGLSEASGTALNTMLATLYAAGTPLQIVYDLATLPDPIILDAEDVKTLLGDNNIFCDTGDVDVTYRADTALYIDKKLGA